MGLRNEYYEDIYGPVTQRELGLATLVAILRDIDKPELIDDPMAYCRAIIDDMAMSAHYQAIARKLIKDARSKGYKNLDKEESNG